MRRFAYGADGTVEVTDVEDYPDLVGRGRTERGAEGDLIRLIETTWHARRLADAQSVLDEMLTRELLPRERLMVLQAMLDDFVVLRRNGWHEI